MTRKVLIIEDDPDIARIVQLHLRDIHCEVDIAVDGSRGLRAFDSGSYDLVVLDLMLPEIDGLAVCRQLRAKPGYPPILMLTARSSEFDRVLGLELGADDYLTKPFSIAELKARVKALFRRVEAMSERQAQTTEQNSLVCGELVINIWKRRIFLGKKSVDLTAKEFDLLVHFARNPGRVYARAQLLDSVWGYGHDGYEHTVNSHINRLRAKIEKNPTQPQYILTVWGVGYKFRDEC
ncbi:MAG: response regulator transcription factor [Pseudomonadota bacterium]